MSKMMQLSTRVPQVPASVENTETSTAHCRSRNLVVSELTHAYRDVRFFPDAGYVPIDLKMTELSHQDGRCEAKSIA